MPRLLGSTSLEIARLVKDRRPVFISGPRRSGLSRAAALSIGYEALSAGDVLQLDLRSTRDLPSVRGSFRQALACDEATVREPESAALALRSAERVRLVTVQNIHAGDADALNWLTRLALIADRGRAFLLEGAVDPDQMIEAAFPDGLSPEYPAVFRAEPPTAWQSLAEFEELFVSQFKGHDTSLIPWLVDVTGGDFGACSELAERLTGQVTSTAIAAALERVSSRGPTFGAIKDTCADAEPELLRKLRDGAVLYEAEPKSSNVKSTLKLYYGGVIVFDPLFEGYRIKSPLVGMIISNILSDRGVVVEQPILGRCSYYLGIVGSVEAGLRGAVRTGACVDAAREISSITTFGPQAKLLKIAIAQLEGIDGEAKKKLYEIVATVLPDKATLLEHAKARRSIGDPPEVGLLVSALNLSELCDIARKLGVLDVDAAVSKRVVDARNAVAHFRPLDVDKAKELRDDARVMVASVRRLAKVAASGAGGP